MHELENYYPKNIIPTEYLELLEGEDLEEAHKAILGATLHIIDQFSIGYAQLGSPDYYEKNNKERDFIIEYLKKKFKRLPKNIYFKWMGFDHDFGRYHEMVIIGDSENRTHIDFANRVTSIDWDSMDSVLDDNDEMDKLLMEVIMEGDDND